MCGIADNKLGFYFTKKKMIYSIAFVQSDPDLIMVRTATRRERTATTSIVP